MSLVRSRAWILALIGLTAAAMTFLHAQSQTLDPGISQERIIAPGEQHLYSLALGAGQSARLELRTELALAVRLGQPGGTATSVIDDASVEDSPQPVTIVAAADGAYEITLRLPDDAKSGSYRLSLDPPQTASDADRQQAQAESLFREGLRLFNQTARETRLSAVDRYRRAAGIFQTLDNRVMQAKSIKKIGQVYNRLGEARLALEVYEQVLDLFRALGDRRNEASMLNNVALERVNLGQYTEAIEPLKAAAAMFDEIGDRWQMRSPINNLGMAYYRLGDVEQSSVQYHRALELARENGDDSGEAYASVGLAVLELLKGNLQQTLDYFTRAYVLWRTLNNPQMEALALGNIGTAHLTFGDAESALDYLLRAMEIRKLAPNRLSDAVGMGNIAAAYNTLGEPQKALDYINEAIRLFRELGIPAQEASALQQLAAIEASRGELEAAATSYSAARTGARAASQRPVEVFALSGLSRVRLKQHAPAEAASLASDAVAMAKQWGLRVAEQEALTALGSAESATNALDAAHDHLSQALVIAESVRASVAGPDQRSAYLDHRHGAYGLATDVLMRLHRERPAAGFDGQAFEVSERARARTLIDLLAESRSNIREGIDPALVAREQTLRASLAARRGLTDDRVQSLLIEYRTLQNDLRARSPRYASLVEPSAVPLDVIQRDLLDAGTVLVEYSLGEERSYVWVVGRESITSRELPSRARIEALARRAHQALGQPSASDRVEALRELSRVVIEPVAAAIAGKRLAIVTEGLLQYIPFAALPDGSGQPLIGSHEIVSLPSASTLQALRRDAAGRTRAPRSLFVVGDPVFDRSDPRVTAAADQKLAATSTAATLERSAREAGAGSLERLWFTRREADSIAALAPAKGVRKLLDFDASLDRVTAGEAASYRVVHFATHGLLNNTHPELSGLVFSLVDARGRPRDGFLPAYEVYNLRLNAEVVVLSACQTALGEDIRGEGLVGLTRAFMYAGTSRVVASLWRVPDSATAALMQRFYRALLVDGLPPARSLRVAQQSIRAEPRWSAPYYWAGFTLAGEWK